jgi:hypothetical protein
LVGAKEIREAAQRALAQLEADANPADGDSA